MPPSKRILSIAATLMLTVSAAHAAETPTQPANASTPPGTVIAQPAAPVQEGTAPIVPADGPPPRLALVLAGGGTRGAAHIGVLKVMKAAGIPIDFIAGSSIGALMGGLYAAGVDPSELERLTLNGQLKKAFFPVPLPLQASVAVPTYCAQRLFFIKPRIGLYSGKSIAKFIHRNVPQGRDNIENLKTHFAAIAINLDDTRPVWLTSGDLGEAVQASCTVPIFYKPVMRGNMMLVDGGIRSNLPTAAGGATGARMVVGVKLHSFLESVDNKSNNVPKHYADRLTSIMMAEIENSEVNGADFLIEPKVQYMALFNFDKETLKRAIAAGEEAAWKMVPQIKSRLRIAASGDPKPPN